MKKFKGISDKEESTVPTAKNSKNKQIPIEENKKIKKRGTETQKIEEIKEEKKKTWTGKYPSTLLHEWSQKNQRSKPNYIQLESDEDHKTQYRFKTVLEHKKVLEEFCAEYYYDTVQEARNMVAVVALHHYCGHLSLHKILPPEASILWQKLEDKAKQKEKDLKEKQATVIVSPQPKKKKIYTQLFMNEDARKLIETILKHSEKSKEKFNIIETSNDNLEKLKKYGVEKQRYN